MRRLERNREILRALLIFGITIGMTMVVGIHPITGSSEAEYDKGFGMGENNCLDSQGSSAGYNPNQGPSNSTQYVPGYNDGWSESGCRIPHKK
jgi:hypothetical protein